MTEQKISKVLLVTILALAIAGCSGGDSEKVEETQVVVADFCEEHQIAESRCPYCDPSIIESLGFCGGHGVPEAFCYLCSPEMIPAFKAVGDWCGGHDRPESQCYICNPELDPERMQAAESSVKIDDSAVAHPATNGYISRRQRPPSLVCSTLGLTVRLDGPEIAENAGFEFATVGSRLISKTIKCNAEIAYDGNRYARLSAQVPGIVVKVHKDLGQQVKPGETLATITSTHLGSAKASFLQNVAAVDLWKRNHERETGLLNRGVSTEKDLLEAETRLAESRILLSQAEQALLSFGVSKTQMDEIRTTGDTSPSYAITAPLAGLVIDRNTAMGEVVDPSAPLFTIADVSRMWASIDIFEDDIRDIAVGQPVVLQVDGLAGDSFAGRITWVSSRLNPQTRTLQARAEFENNHGLLRANMFAEASVSVTDQRNSLVVPESSVQWEGCCNVVFVKTSATVFEPRKVHLGIGTGTFYEILSGLREGEEIVNQGSFLLKTEILKGSIGAGCCEVDPGA